MNRNHYYIGLFELYDELLYSLCYMEGIIYRYNISFILIFYMCLYINVYTHATMIMWAMRFSIITSGEPFSATKCTAVRSHSSFSVRASSLFSSGRQLMSSFIDYNTWRQSYHYTRKSFPKSVMYNTLNVTC